MNISILCLAKKNHCAINAISGWKQCNIDSFRSKDHQWVWKINRQSFNNKFNMVNPSDKQRAWHRNLPVWLQLGSSSKYNSRFLQIKKIWYYQQSRAKGLCSNLAMLFSFTVIFVSHLKVHLKLLITMPVTVQVTRAFFFTFIYYSFTFMTSLTLVMTRNETK